MTVPGSIPLPEDVALTVIASGSAEYEQAKDLRWRVLYEPIGMDREKLEADEESAPTLHLAAFRGPLVIGYARLILEGETARMRQLAVDPEWQRDGIGSALVLELLDHAAHEGANEVVLDAREAAVPFYERLGFEVVSDMFLSKRTGTPHFKMRRDTEPAPEPEQT